MPYSDSAIFAIVAQSFFSFRQLFLRFCPRATVTWPFATVPRSFWDFISQFLWFCHLFWDFVVRYSDSAILLQWLGHSLIPSCHAAAIFLFISHSWDMVSHFSDFVRHSQDFTQSFVSSSTCSLILIAHQFRDSSVKKRVCLGSGIFWEHSTTVGGNSEFVNLRGGI
jgi:hypothetical protein